MTRADYFIRKCSQCGRAVRKRHWCPHCVAVFEDRRDAATMSGEERAAEMRLWRGRLEIPFSLLHKRIEELVGRPVWTHEMGLNFEGLIEEATTWKHPGMDEVLDLIPEDKRVIVAVAGDTGDAAKAADERGQAAKYGAAVTAIAGLKVPGGEPQ